ncbi:CheY chemotaxis protein or a CheY-like REC (receiver) domain [Desulfuromusa kysingii]|uniref:CheY chemotaxis protein or a CheY-like REC (Receiver) domain n=1 Tax=Desulfuromusa kysingii TaxID=37625 RepID=A0A1H4AM16_9BACT|nr:response regulator [Desulfuromusa kysingii]SEA36827.1 CheY chemotaxis protein or a CheY-like REC (receiver) domain [Desulfuromusa kysingii]
MVKNNGFKLSAFAMVLIVTGVFSLSFVGFGLTPLNRYFGVLISAIIGLSSVPAALQFISMIKKISVGQLAATEQSPSKKGVCQMKARKILIADKDLVNRKQLAELFEKSHYEVETTASAAYAIAKIVQKNEPIVILGDSFEEKIASSDVVALMRKCNKNLQIILVSDDTSLDALRRMREDGVFYHALKPHNQEDNEELRSAVECALEAFHPAMS